MIEKTQAEDWNYAKYLIKGWKKSGQKDKQMNITSALRYVSFKNRTAKFRSDLEKIYGKL